MNCQRVQNLLSALIDHEIEPVQKQELRRHLIECPECHAEHTALLRLKECFGNLTKPELSYDTMAGLRLRLAAEPGSSASFLTGFNLALFRNLGLTGACLLLFLLLTALLYPAAAPSNGIASGDNLYAPSNVAASDQTFSLDQSVTVYQASLELP
jgi:anti-sigma factor RsiW